MKAHVILSINRPFFFRMVLRGSKTKGSTVQNFFYGGIAGGFSRTVVAPLDRVKILMQTTTSKQTLRQMFRSVLQQEGFFSLWKGNVLNCARIVPYSAMQFGTYDLCKVTLFEEPLSVPQRFTCGSFAGIVATTVTHPIDVIRHRLLMNADIHTFGQAARDVLAEKGMRSFLKGYGSTMSGLVPFIAVNFCTFDTLKSELQWTSTAGILGTGALAALISQSICYPLDTIRRRMQIRGTPYKHGLDAFWQIIRKEGFLNLYAGISANALKIIPNNSIRFLVYEICRSSLDF